MKKEYGEVIPGLQINGELAPYGVVNERSIRATAGLMFVIGFSVFAYIRATGDYTPMYFVVPMFWLDFLLKTIFSPKFSIFGFFGKLFVRSQKPEYVGAIQKRFAWGIGLFLSSIMMVVALGFQVKGIIPFSICMTCLFFMWLESACGICVGCNIYKFLQNRGIISKKKFQPACPGGVCSIRK